MIETISLRLAQYIKKANPEETVSVEIMKYALMVLLNGIAIAALSATIGLITGKFWETILTMTAFVILRFLTGGRHLGDSDSCVFWSTIAMVVTPHIPVSASFVWGMIGLSFIIVAVFAPLNMHEKVRIPKRYLPLMKGLSLGLISANVFIFSAVIAKAFFLQSLFLISFKSLKGGENNEK